MKIISLLSLTLLLNISLFANESLSLDQAIDILKKQNLEIQVASLEIKSAVAEADTVSGISLGKLDFTQDMARSNDAGNVFG
ncbi:MAG: TolC family protein, partial [Helicobacteraceae bacterium]|nr:TolC family protein [Candidatus Sulfurimonas ponti]